MASAHLERASQQESRLAYTVEHGRCKQGIRAYTAKSVSSETSGQVHISTPAYAGVGCPSGPANIMITFSSAAHALLCSLLPMLTLCEPDCEWREASHASDQQASCSRAAKQRYQRVFGQRQGLPRNGTRNSLLSLALLQGRHSLCFPRLYSVSSNALAYRLLTSQSVYRKHSSMCQDLTPLTLIHRLLFCGPSKVVDSLHSPDEMLTSGISLAAIRSAAAAECAACP